MSAGRWLHVFCESSRSGSTLTRRCTIERRDGERVITSDVLWYDFHAMERLPPEDDAEPFLIATIMQAMVEGRSLSVHGAVSRTLLSNLTEYRDAWHCWLPREYARIDFESDTITDPAPSDKRDQAVVAYSGGLDGAFSVWRHSQGNAGFRTQKIRCRAFVHGFDTRCPMLMHSPRCEELSSGRS